MPQARRTTLVGAVFAAAAVALVGSVASPALADGSIAVNDLVLTRGISAREPVDNAKSFSEGDSKAFAFARIRNDGPPTTVNFVWHFGDEEHGSVAMKVGTSRAWRTWSSANLTPGDWRIEIKDASGTILMSKAFTVEGATASSEMEQETTSAVTEALPTSQQEDAATAVSEAPVASEPEGAAMSGYGSPATLTPSHEDDSAQTPAN